jgi:two-component system, chemotaxis family, CheB/CheR fusion protein
VLFGLNAGDIGRPIQDLEVSYRPLELRRAIADASRHGRRLQLGRVELSRGGSTRSLEVEVQPLHANGDPLGVAVSFVDLTELVEVGNRLEESKRQLASTYEELQSTVEELETTNEELQSTNEELETTNEELQSTNEELETMNEELQSANEELETMNDELRHRTLELNEMNSFLETILTTIGLAVAVLDNRQYVQIWNGQAREMWGVSPEEAADQHLFALEIGLPMDQLKQPLRACLSGASEREELVLDAINRRGKAFQCRVVCLPLTSGGDGAISGVILLMEQALEAAAA